MHFTRRGLAGQGPLFFFLETAISGCRLVTSTLAALRLCRRSLDGIVEFARILLRRSCNLRRNHRQAEGRSNKMSVAQGLIVEPSVGPTSPLSLLAARPPV